jgi:hypothetical protein
MESSGLGFYDEVVLGIDQLCHAFAKERVVIDQQNRPSFHLAFFRGGFLQRTRHRP